ncbi:ATP-binding protein [Microcoleus sp. ARI1-B5]|uniref:sensor histidine kinase n=1 Tax=unclassified Microcoleus TaxID=2642155 RepID=UPI002FD40053
MAAPNPLQLPDNSNPPRWLVRSPAGLRVLLVAAIYLTSWYALDVVALQFESAPEIQIWYPPSALDVVLLLVFGLRWWPLLLLNTFVRRWFVTGRHLPLHTLPIFDAVTTLGCAGACNLLLHKLRINPPLRQLRDAIWFTLIAGIGAPLVVAVLQVVNFVSAGLISWDQWQTFTLHYWAGDSTGIGMLAPFLLILLRKFPKLWAGRDSIGRWARGGYDELRWPSRPGWPVLLFHIVLLAFGIWAAYGAPRGKNLDYSYFVFLPMISIVAQYGFARATATVLGINIGIALLVGYKTGVQDTLALQFGLMAVTHAGILLGAIVTDRQRTAEKLRLLYKKLRSLNRGLEIQVQERTAQLQEKMQQLHLLSQVKDDFLSTVSHELRSLMANMTVAIRMLQLGANPQSRDRYLQILQDECARETVLINDLLDLQRLESGRDTLDLQPLELHDWLPHIVEPFHDRARSRQQTLSIEFADNLPVLMCDRAKLERIVTELLTNACKYTPPEGKIAVALRARTSAGFIDGVILTVSNTGVEIPQEQQTRIFEKFYRIPSSDYWMQGGTGLGLALVQKLVEQLGTEIRAESRSMETVFTVDLPAGCCEDFE